MDEPRRRMNFNRVSLKKANGYHGWSAVSTERYRKVVFYFMIRGKVYGASQSLRDLDDWQWKEFDFPTDCRHPTYLRDITRPGKGVTTRLDDTYGLCYNRDIGIYFTRIRRDFSSCHVMNINIPHRTAGTFIRRIFRALTMRPDTRAYHLELRGLEKLVGRSFTCMKRIYMTERHYREHGDSRRSIVPELNDRRPPRDDAEWTPLDRNLEETVELYMDRGW
jgi:hypothetical protein